MAKAQRSARPKKVDAAQESILKEARDRFEDVASRDDRNRKAALEDTKFVYVDKSQWPDLIPDATIDDVKYMAGSGQLIIGNPDDALEQCQRWASTGVGDEHHW